MNERKSLSAVWREAIRDSDLPMTAKLVAFVLVDLGASATADELAPRASISARTAKRALGQLKAAGYLGEDDFGQDPYGFCLPREVWERLL